MENSTVSTPRPVVDLSASSHALLCPAPLAAVQLLDKFWQPRRKRNLGLTLLSQWQRMSETGRLQNFRRTASWLRGEVAGEPFEGTFFNDSDVYKWLEAACSALESAFGLGEERADCKELRARVDEGVALIAAAQHPDGYLNNYYSVELAGKRWENLRDKHELYCAGHFLQAAVAHFRLTTSRVLLEVAERLAACIELEFGWGKREESDGHEEIELALIELYRATGESRWLKLAQFFMDVRGARFVLGNYHQAHVPFRELNEVTGHAVRALYYAASGADLYLETGDSTLLEALRRQWRSFTRRRMYVSGGAGARHEGETFGADYELPNARAYSETCAGVAAIMWAHRMGHIGGDAEYFDVLETVLYNVTLAGIALDGEHYFYVNPLADDGRHRRSAWFGCACCPANVSRLLAQLPGYFYSTGLTGVWVHLFATSRAELQLPGGERVVLAQKTNYPWSGAVEFTIEEATGAEFSLHLRIPAWAQGTTLDGAAVEAGAYAEIRRAWQAGDRIRLELPLDIRSVQSHPAVVENAGRQALLRGPLLYCLESCDNPGHDLRLVGVGDLNQWQAEHRPGLLEGVTVLAGPGLAHVPAKEWEDALYLPGAADADQKLPVNLTAVPYYAWANREAGQMQVWSG